MCMWVWRPRVGWLDVVVHTSSLLWCLILGRVLPTTKDVWYDVCMPTWVYKFVCLYQCIHVGMIRCLYELMYVHIGNVGTDDTYREKNVAVRAYECCLCFGYIFSLMYSCWPQMIVSIRTNDEDFIDKQKCYFQQKENIFFLSLWLKTFCYKFEKNFWMENFWDWSHSASC